MYGITKKAKKIQEAKQRLHVLYSKIPDTKGCMENINKEQGCNAWCCKINTPQVLYIEFLNAWEHIAKKWERKDILILIERTLNKYVYNNKDKSCVFINHETNFCNIHDKRPFNCRIYGITPEEEFKPRYERLKVIYPEIKDQCNLVSTVDGSVVSTKNTENWWLEANSIEMSVGIKKEMISDDVGGSYRTYHDHILVHVFGENSMYLLSDLRQFSSDDQKEKTIANMLDSLKDFNFAG